jgi:hypothetical protein
MCLYEFEHPASVFKMSRGLEGRVIVESSRIINEGKRV